MIGNNQVCGLCNLEASIEGCLCDGAVILLCSACSRAHFIDRAKEHNFIDVELALRMQADPSLVHFYLEEQVKILKLHKVLRDRSNKAENVKRRYLVYKQKLVSHVEEIFYKLIGEIEEMTKDYSDKIKILNTYKTNLFEEGSLLIQKFQSSGLNSIVRNSIEGIDIPIDDVLEYITNLMNGQRSSIQDSSNISERDRIFEALRSELAEMKQQKELLSKAYSNQILENSDHKHRISMLNTQIAELRRGIEDDLIKRNMINNLQERLKRQVNDMTDISNLNQNLYEENQSLIDSQNHLSSRIVELEESCNKSKEEIRKLNESVQRLQKDLDTEAFVSSKDRAYIYIPSNNTKSILQYDIIHEKAKVIDIPSLSRDLMNTSSCALPNGDVFIAGFTNPICNQAYLYKIDSKVLLTLPHLSYPRYLMALFYYRSYVYAFGGVNSNHAERYSILNNSWEILPNMKYKTSSLSCVGIDDKIYLFKGGYKKIEVFDTTKLSFEELEIENSDIYSSDRGVAYKMGVRVYLLTDNFIQIYDIRLNKLAEYPNTFKYYHYSIYNIIRHNNFIYYYNHYTLNVERIDAALPILDPQVYSHNPNKFIYKIRVNTRDIQRIDLEYSTIENINLSETLNREFDSTSLCLLDYGEVVIAGFNNPLSGECYLFSPHNKSCIRLPDLNHPRYNTTLIYYKNTVYVFGGMNHAKNIIKSAEKINILAKRSWIILPDMIQARAFCSCIGIDDNIYIMGGGHSSIEIFSLNTNSYLSANISLSSTLVVSVIIDDRIHIIGKKNYTILTSNLEAVADYRYRYGNGFYLYTMGNIVCYGEKIYFYNQSKKLLERVNTVNCEREVHFVTHRSILI